MFKPEVVIDDSPQLHPSMIHNWQQVLQAAENGDLGMLKVQRKSDGKWEHVIVVVLDRTEDGGKIVAPIARFMTEPAEAIFHAPIQASTLTLEEDEHGMQNLVAYTTPDATKTKPN